MNPTLHFFRWIILILLILNVIRPALVSGQEPTTEEPAPTQQDPPPEPTMSELPPDPTTELPPDPTTEPPPDPTTQEVSPTTTRPDPSTIEEPTPTENVSIQFDLHTYLTLYPLPTCPARHRNAPFNDSSTYSCDSSSV